jgi:threonine dehydratase
LVSLTDVNAAFERICATTGVHQTPVMTSNSLDGLAGASLFFKCEHLQKTGSFKARGALNAVRSLDAVTAAKGVATHSSGNHGAALAWAAASRNIPAFVVVPSNAPLAKKQNIALHGAEIIECEPTLQAREATLAEVVRRTGATYIPPYDDERVIAGQGTASLELLAQVADLDIIVTPVGGGGLLAGSILSAGAGIKVFGAEPAMADDAFRSLASGIRVTTHTPQTIADGLQTTLGERNFAIIKPHCAGILLVSEDEIRAAMTLIWTRLKQLVEPSSAVTLAAVLRYPEHFAGQRVGLVLTGGNMTLPALGG